MTNVTLAGASGFVGQNLFNYLIDKRFNVQQLSLRNSNWEIEVNNDTDAFINLVGKAHDHKGQATEEDFFYANYQLTKEIFQVFLDSKASLFIHLSSIAVLEEEGFDGILDENNLSNSKSYYGKSKKKSEEFLLNYKLPEGKKVVIIRPTMIHGPNDKGNLTLLFKIINKGIPYPLGAFKNKRSFLGIYNLCFVIESVILKQQEILSGVYNLADDEYLSTEQIIRSIGELSNKKVKILFIPRKIIFIIARIGDFLSFPLNSKRLNKMISNLLVSNKKIKSALKIEKLPLTAEEGLEVTIKSFLN